MEEYASKLGKGDYSIADENTFFDTLNNDYVGGAFHPSQVD